MNIVYLPISLLSLPNNLMSLVPGVDTSEFRNDFWKRTRSDYDLETLIGLCKGHFDEVALVINLVEVPSKDVY